jgi:hypothetical protein
MDAKRSSPRRHEGTQGRGRLGMVLGMFVPIGTVLVALVLLPRELRSQAGPGQEAAFVPPCGKRHGPGGRGEALDLPAVREGYLALARRVERRLELPLAAPRIRPEALLPAGGEGLPACRGAESRTVKVPPEAARRLRGRVLYAAELRNPAGFRLPAAFPREAGKGEILLTSAPGVREVRELSLRLGVPVQMARPELLRALGIRCGGTLLVVSPDSLEVKINEAP